MLDATLLGRSAASTVGTNPIPAPERTRFPRENEPDLGAGTNPISKAGREAPRRFDQGRDRRKCRSLRAFPEEEVAALGG